MGQDASQGGAPVSARRPEEIRHEIEELREELGETVEALTAKADVKAQAREKVEEIKSGVRERAPERVDPDRVMAVAKGNRLPLAIGLALLLGFLIGRGRGRRRED